MGILTFILGKSGSGKSNSLRNFPKDKVAVINVQGKILPFRASGEIETTNTDKSDRIMQALDIYSKSYKSIVIDDFQYTMANEFMRRSSEKGFDKFTEIGRHAWDILNKVNELPNDVIVYVLAHTDRDDEGNEKIKTIGKLLDEKICLEGMSPIVLKTNVTDGIYTFITQNNGKDTVKSPAGMFPSYAIDNDLYYVDQKIRNYFSIGEFLTDEEIAEIDEEAKNVDVIKPEKKTRGGRRSAKKEEEPTNTPKEEKEEETTKKRTRRTREEVQADNDSKVAEQMQDDPREEVPFDEAETPEVEKLPRRKKRTTEADTEPTEAETQTEEATPTRTRRRRRA